MNQFILRCGLVVALALPSSGADPRPLAQRVARPFAFPVVGQLKALSVADLAEAARAVPQPRIYLLRIVSPREVEAEVTRLSRGTVTCQIVERVHGRWQATDHVIKQE